MQLLEVEGEEALGDLVQGQDLGTVLEPEREMEQGVSKAQDHPVGPDLEIARGQGGQLALEQEEQVEETLLGQFQVQVQD